MCFFCVWSDLYNFFCKGKLNPWKMERFNVIKKITKINNKSSLKWIIKSDHLGSKRSFFTAGGGEGDGRAKGRREYVFANILREVAAISWERMRSLLYLSLFLFIWKIPPYNFFIHACVVASVAKFCKKKIIQIATPH